MPAKKKGGSRRGKSSYTGTKNFGGVRNGKRVPANSRFENAGEGWGKKKSGKRGAAGKGGRGGKGGGGGG